MAGKDNYQTFTDEDFLFRKVVRATQAPQAPESPISNSNISPSTSAGPSYSEQNQVSPNRTHQIENPIQTLPDRIAQPLQQTVSTKPRIDLTAESPLPHLPYPTGMPIIAESSRDSISTSIGLPSIRRQSSPARQTPFSPQVTQNTKTPQQSVSPNISVVQVDYPRLGPVRQQANSPVRRESPQPAQLVENSRRTPAPSIPKRDAPLQFPGARMGGIIETGRKNTSFKSLQLKSAIGNMMQTPPEFYVSNQCNYYLEQMDEFLKGGCPMLTELWEDLKQLLQNSFARRAEICAQAILEGNRCREEHAQAANIISQTTANNDILNQGNLICSRNSHNATQKRRISELLAVRDSYIAQIEQQQKIAENKASYCSNYQQDEKSQDQIAEDIANQLLQTQAVNLEKQNIKIQELKKDIQMLKLRKESSALKDFAHIIPVMRSDPRDLCQRFVQASNIRK